MKTPYCLVSIWDMYKLDASRFYEAVTILGRCGAHLPSPVDKYVHIYSREGV
jgi:hypothetical protein